MKRSSELKIIPAKESSPAARSRPELTLGGARGRPLRKPKVVVKAKGSSSRRLLLSGQTRAELRTLGVALAAELDRDLYCVDLSRVVSRTIGETEKNLARLFAVAEATGAVLFFDEADALLGKRTGVKDSHDRYANQEVSYLLERIERYPGMVILASNNRKKLDEAFLRRLRFTSALEHPVRRRSV
jgi:SpoVK/Ycf46/Vps4 family AAA+-type ATPase